MWIFRLVTRIYNH